MLLGEDGGGGQHRHLFVGVDGFEDGADGDFRFAEADIAADETIHGAIALHVQLHILHRFELIGVG
jgi:hypothetical protein